MKFSADILILRKLNWCELRALFVLQVPCASAPVKFNSSLHGWAQWRVTDDRMAARVYNADSDGSSSSRSKYRHGEVYNAMASSPPARGTCPRMRAIVAPSRNAAHAVRSFGPSRKRLSVCVCVRQHSTDGTTSAATAGLRGVFWSSG